MKLIDIVNGPWAITPEMLGEIQEIYRTHMRGEKISIPDVEAKLGRKLDNSREDSYHVIDGVAVLDLDGPLARRANLFMRISGGTSTELLQRDFHHAMDDPQVDSVLLMVNSPGGTVAGTQELAETIYSRRGEKPVVALAEDVMASAAYWIGAAADKIYISESTTMVGSIGVVAGHVDYSKYEEKMGVKTTEITAGKYKRISSQYAPLSEEGRADIQAKLDHLYSIFVDSVATFRGVSSEEVLERMADGRVFIGQQAIDAGLVDGVSTLAQLLESMRDKSAVKSFAAAGVASAKNLTEEIMTLEELKASNPELVEQIEAAAREGYVPQADIDEQLEAARVEGAEGERTRIQAVEDQLIPGHEALVNDLKFDGQTTGPEAAAKVLAAEKKHRQSHLAKEGDGNDIVPGADGGDGGSGVDENAPIEERAKASWDADAKLRTEFGGSFDAYLAYRKAEESGSAKVLKK